MEMLAKSISQTRAYYSIEGRLYAAVFVIFSQNNKIFFKAKTNMIVYLLPPPYDL